jgi:hypothetical protein
LIINYLIFAHKEVGSNMGDINIAHIWLRFEWIHR